MTAAYHPLYLVAPRALTNDINEAYDKIIRTRALQSIHLWINTISPFVRLSVNNIFHLDKAGLGFLELPYMHLGHGAAV